MRSGARLEVCVLRIENDGNTSSTACTSGCYLSEDSTITTSDKFLAAFSTPALAAAGSWTHSTSVTIPLTASLGDCYLGVVADQKDSVRESLENNNTIAKVLTCADGTPDLTIKAVVANSSTLVGGSTVQISSTTSNNGTGVSGTSTTLHVISTDSVLSAADILCATYTTGSIAIGGAWFAPDLSFLGFGSNSPENRIRS